MESEVARFIWKRGQYSDIYHSTIINSFQLKEGQKVKMIS